MNLFLHLQRGNRRPLGAAALAFGLLMSACGQPARLEKAADPPPIVESTPTFTPLPTGTPTQILTVNEGSWVERWNLLDISGWKSGEENLQLQDDALSLDNTFGRVAKSWYSFINRSERIPLSDGFVVNLVVKQEGTEGSVGLIIVDP